MAETSKNKIYYNDNENSIADVLEDMKKLAESTDNAIEKAKYNDTELKNKDTAQDEDIAQIKEKDTTQDELIEQLQAENTKLKKEINSMQIPGEATGNPIHLTDSSDLECEIAVVGNSEQETRSGSNILNFNVTQDSKVTVNDDGTVTINGTGGFGLKFEGITLKSGTTYYQKYQIISGSVTNSSDTGKIFMTIKEGQGYLTEGEFKSVSVTEDTNSNYVWIHANAVFENAKIKMWANTDQSDFEPYGASPSPDYPSEVVTVGQNVNIFDKDNTNTLNAIINGTTKQIANFDTCRSIYISCDNNEDYTISRKAGTRFVVGTTTNIPVLNATCNQIVQNNTADSITIKTTENDNYLVVFYYNSGTDTLTEEEIRNSIKIEKGLVATPYSPYGQGSVEIEICNKNLAKINETNWELTENNTIKNKARNNGADLATIKIKKGSTAKICLKLFSKPTAATTFICWLDSETQASKSFINFNGYNLNKIYINSITAEKDIEIRYQNSGNANSEIFEFQFWAEIDEATDYIPHESYTKVLPTQKEFVKIGDVEDTFVKVDGKWYEKHCIKKLILDGTNINWYKAGVNTVDRYSTKDFLGKYGGKILCTHFKYANGTDELGTMWLSSASAQIYLNFAEYGTSTVADLNSWLAERYANGTPVVIYYELAEPELIECTEGQESVLNSFYTYKGVTNVSMSGIGKIKIIYKQDQQTINKNYENRLAALEAAIIS